MRLTSVFRLMLIGTAAAAMVTPSSAGVIDYALTPIGDGVWRYDYSLQAPLLAFDQFTVYFDPAQFTELAAVAGPVGWDVLVLPPDPAIPASGLFDGVHLAGPLTQGGTFTGFSVSVRYGGLDAPGSQPYELLDSSTLWVLQSGFTTPVPEPPPALMLIGGLVGLAGMGRRRWCAAPRSASTVQPLPHEACS